jgi:hypothetical protein
LLLLLRSHVSPSPLRAWLLSSPWLLLHILLPPGALLSRGSRLLALPIACACRRGCSGLLLAASPEEEEGHHHDDERDYYRRNCNHNGRADSKNGC